MENKANLSGKIKRIIERDTFTSATYFRDFKYYYDSTTGLLKTVFLNDTSLVTIDYLSQDKIKLSYKSNLLHNSDTILYAYIDRNGYISKITKYDRNSYTENAVMLIYRNAQNLPDSSRGYSLPFDYLYTNDYTTFQNNITQFKTYYSSYFTGEQETSIQQFFNTQKHQTIPLQNRDILYNDGMSYAASSPVYLLSLCNILPYPENNNLIDSVWVDIIGVEKTTIKYNYEYNMHNQVSIYRISSIYYNLVSTIEYY
jgi:hypothetical protein